MGDGAEGLSPATISRLKRQWEAEHAAWQERDLRDRRSVDWWADGVDFNIRAEAARQCLLGIIGVTEAGTQEFGAIADGALGFWKALTTAFGPTRHQRCGVPKPANVLNKRPKGLQKQAKGDLHAVLDGAHAKGGRGGF